jgi:hypothetical protein
MSVAMTVSVRVHAPLCDHATRIEATSAEGGVVVRIESTCKNVRHYAELLGPLRDEDMIDIRTSQVFTRAAEAGLTATCLIPVAVMNAAWAEVGNISYRLAKEKGPLCISFE